MKEACLGPGIRIHTQRVVVLPINVQPPRDLQDSGSTIRPASLTARLILSWIPGICDLTAFGIERNHNVIAFVRHNHAETPLFGYLRYPISRVIVRGSRARRCWGYSLGSGWPLPSETSRKQKRYR